MRLSAWGWVSQGHPRLMKPIWPNSSLVSGEGSHVWWMCFQGQQVLNLGKGQILLIKNLHIFPKISCICLGETHLLIGYPILTPPLFLSLVKKSWNRRRRNKVHLGVMPKLGLIDLWLRILWDLSSKNGKCAIEVAPSTGSNYEFTSTNQRSTRFTLGTFFRT